MTEHHAAPKQKALDITLYGILDAQSLPPARLAQAALEAVKGGVTLLQYRDKHASTRAMIERAQEILTQIRHTNVPLLINDRADVAMMCGAQGVHLGQDDLTPAQARRILGSEALIGRTIKNKAHAAALEHEDVDYACIGGVYETLSKHNPEPPLGVAGFQALREQIRALKPHLPVGAIAGIDLGKIHEIFAARSDGVALIGALFREANILHAAKTLRRTIDITRASL